MAVNPLYSAITHFFTPLDLGRANMGRYRVTTAASTSTEIDRYR